MVMAVNNSALLGAGAVVDPSGWANQFREGQKLRQEYETRQQQKALNELMGIDDFNERIAKARTHKYAGALVPQLQQYEEARQKAALDNLKSSADIGKTYAETGKLGAESGKIGAEAEGETLKTAQGISDYISAAAVTQDPKAFGLKIGELYKRGLITSEQTQGLLGLTKSDTESAAVVLQRLAMGNPEIAKVFTPQAKTLDAGDAVYQYTVNPFTGQASDPTAKIAKGVSPDNALDNETSRLNNQNTVAGSMYNSDNSLAGQKYTADANYDAKIYGTDAQTAQNNQQLAVDWYNAETKRTAAKNPTKNPRPVAATKEMNKHYTNMKNNAKTLRETANWIRKIESGQFSLGALSNAGNNAANFLGVDALGSNPAAYAEFKANMTKLASDALRLNAGVQTDMDYKRELEAMQAGDYLPRSNKTALALLTKIVRDFDTKNRAEYEAYSNYRREYDGVSMPAYGASNKTKSTKATPTSKGQAIGKKVFGGG